MTGRAEVHRLRQILDATFERVTHVGTDAELQSDFARYLCILVSGYFEKAIAELLLEHGRRNASPRVLRFLEYRARTLVNINAQRLQDLFGTFDPDWRQDLEQFLVDEKKDALDSVVNLRNKIAHGQSVGVTYMRIRGYYQQIQAVIEHVAELCVPVT